MHEIWEECTWFKTKSQITAYQVRRIRKVSFLSINIRNKYGIMSTRPENKNRDYKC